jgi:DNA replication protein DnaC
MAKSSNLQKSEKEFKSFEVLLYDLFERYKLNVTDSLEAEMKSLNETEFLPAIYPLPQLTGKKLILKIAKNLVRDYQFDEFNKEIFSSLYLYFNGIEESLNLNKGIFLIGNIGAGKTRIMQIFSEYLLKTDISKFFTIASVRQIQEQYTQFGIEAMNKYKNNSSENNFFIKVDAPCHFCFDDLGTESEKVKHYGTELNIIEELLFARYELLINQKIFTHITTNLTVKSMERKYSKRLMSRFKEMFNFIELPGGDRRC